MVDTPTPIINKVRNRFLPLTESVAKGLEREPRITDFEKIKLIGKGYYEVIHKGKSIGKFDKYDLDTLNNAQVGATLNFVD